MRRIHLNAFDMACVGHQSPGLWRHPDDQAHRYTDLSYWTDLARLLERGGFDSLFIADVLGVYDVYQGSRDAAVRQGAQIPLSDPLPAVSAMAAVTRHLGFGVTVSLTYEQPYKLARTLTTLDHLTKGRVAWNVVTSYLASAARNLGLGEQLAHDDRYEVAEEFLEVCYKLWEYSWDDDAVVRDPERGLFTDPARIRDIAHEGKHFSVPGVFLSEPSPQRTPVVFQAGASPRGRAFAARHGEGVFINAVTSEATRRVVDDIRARADAEGRDPYGVKIYILLTAITAPTDEEARAKHADLASYASYEGALALYGGWSGLDLSTLDPDEPLAYVDTDAVRSALAIFSTADPSREWTPDQVARYLGIGGIGPVVVGAPDTVADELERWVEEADIDGFNLAYATTPGTFTDFVDLVVPELRARGRMPHSYEGATLREHLHGPGTPRVPEDHPAARHRERAARLSSPGFSE
ncbi:NtaA/SnaA/SoxA family monooxygenase [Streptomyces himastatinicus ATCC 53653]|uniref:NtaA/SnaA/SoxA family monooxygenase n=1 Tax=Streptomyces himastatinicus ATCC 53653 TaxID=457427 RepID=D9WSJ3_9ACTN|nr:LLM class flavin-dependent oxidoreductase [Streptomyces himastatinicus]EFL22134.1 NtaA/SnaA/SoxA family monooxygenase [Streptomyces himastatinicus ATCC 53653]CCC21129.1 putative monoxygenase [Streptomyces himastatinicus ATCC 53653]